MLQIKQIVSFAAFSLFVVVFTTADAFGAQRGGLFGLRAAPVQYYALGPKTSLFPNDSLELWMNGKGEAPNRGWVLEDGTLTRKSSAGDMITKNDYEYYVLEFDWKISPKGNSGVKYRVKKYGNNYLGCEYQVLDDAQAGGERNLTGALYDVYAPGENKKVNPAGEFNHSKIVVFSNRIEHWLNGEKIVDVRSGTRDWREHVAKGKFKDIEGFGENRFGKILIQDHGNEVQFKNVTIQQYVPVQKRHGIQSLLRR